MDIKIFHRTCFFGVHPLDQTHIAGAAVSTPLTSDLNIDHSQLVAHTRTLLSRGIDLLTLFGTTGEGASFSATERQAAIAACQAAGITPQQLGSGIFALTASAAGAEARGAFDHGCGHVLLAPPSYYKGVDDEGLYRWFSEAITAAGPNPGGFVLYHIPSFTQVPLSVDLVKRLAAAFPNVVTGVKDSSGNWPHTAQLIKERASLQIFVGHEGQLEQGMQAGATGAISGAANVIPEVIKGLVHDQAHAENLPALIDVLLAHPIIAAVKALIAHRQADPSWRAVRAPLTALPPVDGQTVGQQLDQLFPA